VQHPVVAAAWYSGPEYRLNVAGYYDVATPFNGIEHTVSHLGLEPSIRKNLSFAYYEAGHMMYIEKKSRERLHRDVTTFIVGAANQENRVSASP
jgi:carboxypeptidase C (cathepsin A)